MLVAIAIVAGLAVGSRYWPPVDARTRAKSCRVHDWKLQDDVVPIYPGSAIYRYEYLEWAKKNCPHRGYALSSGRRLAWKRRARVKFCAKCRSQSAQFEPTGPDAADSIVGER